MREQTPSFKRIYSPGLSEKERKLVAQEGKNIFEKQEIEELEDLEREKTPREIEIINFINKQVNGIRRRFGLEELHIPIKNVHLIKDDKRLKKPKKFEGAVRNKYHAIYIFEQPNEIVLARILFHEFIHFGSYRAVYYIPENNSFEDYRIGFNIKNRTKNEVYFNWLNEAITERLTKEFREKGREFFEKEMKESDKIIEANPDAISIKGTPLFSRDTFFVKRGKLKDGRIFRQRWDFTYKEERQMLHELIDKIMLKNPGRFKDQEEVFNIFAKAAMTGNILPVARIIEGSFGKGTFRKLGSLGEKKVDNRNENLAPIKNFIATL